MTRETFNRQLNAQWAEYYNQDSVIMNADGTIVVPFDMYKDRRVALYAFKNRVIAQVAPALVDDVKSMLQNRSLSYRLTVDDLISEWDVTPKASFESYIFHIYPPDFLVTPPPEGFTVRRLTEADDAAMKTFKAPISDDELEEGDVDITQDDSTGIFDGDTLAAVSSSYVFRGFVDVGVLTHPDYRRKKLGRAVVSSVVEAILERKDTPLYRADVNNIGSAKIAQRLGFREFARVYALVLE